MTRENKNQPQELSSKNPVSVLREVVPVNKRKYIDPRFDRSFGHLNEDLFKQSYSFVKDLRTNERKELEKTLTKEKNSERAEAIKKSLDRIKSMEKTREKEENLKNLLKERRKVEAELVAQGKKPYYLKKADVKKLELMDKYKKLKAKNPDQPLDIDKIAEKKRKHKASKQHVLLPNRK